MRGALSVLFPAECICCHGTAGSDTMLCDRCAEKLLRPQPPFCTYCGVSLEDCRCRKTPHPYEACIAPFYYEGTVRDAILALKFGGREDASFFLAQELSKTVNAEYFGIRFDLITCVPTTNSSEAARGYNQAESIAKRMCIDTGFGESPEADFHLLCKKETDQFQHMLDAYGRKRNIRNAFALSKGRNVSGKTILLVDDILTTGATAGECASILRLNGAAAVYTACAAVTRNTGAQYQHTKESIEKS